MFVDKEGVAGGFVRFVSVCLLMSAARDAGFALAMYGSFATGRLRACVHMRDKVFAPWPSNSDLLPVGTAPICHMHQLARPAAGGMEKAKVAEADLDNDLEERLKNLKS